MKKKSPNFKDHLAESLKDPKFLKEILKQIVEEESEISDNMPDKIWNILNGDRDATEQSHRFIVKQVTQNILKRINNLFK